MPQPTNLRRLRKYSDFQQCCPHRSFTPVFKRTPVNIQLAPTVWQGRSSRNSIEKSPAEIQGLHQNPVNHRKRDILNILSFQNLLIEREFNFRITCTFGRVHPFSVLLLFWLFGNWNHIQWNTVFFLTYCCRLKLRTNDDNDLGHPSQIKTIPLNVVSQMCATSTRTQSGMFNHLPLPKQSKFSTSCHLWSSAC